MVQQHLLILHIYTSCHSQYLDMVHQQIVSLLCQAADRFMHMLELHGGPEHLVVFITSDQDFCEKIQELQRRNFKVVVLYHKHCASQRPASISQVADKSHDWLTFLKQEMGIPHLSLAPHDPQAYHGASPAKRPGATAHAAPAFSRQPSQESRQTSRVSILMAAVLLHVLRCT